MQRPDDRSRMSGDVHVRFCEKLRGKFPRLTRLVCHCQSEVEAIALKAELKYRFEQCMLVLHPMPFN